MPTPNPKIIVIIPTRERSDVLQFALRTVTDQDYDNLEIIVSDNCSEDGTREVVAAAGDPRVRYIRTGKRVAMSANWEFALSHADDGWVTFMGDDDGLPPRAVSKIAELLRQEPADAIRSRFCTYDWPAAAGQRHGRLIVPLGSGSESRSAAAWLKRSLSGFAKYTELPMAYNGGFVHTKVFQRAKCGGPNFFRSFCPDVYSAVAVASVVDRYIYCREPLAISGTSRHSTGNSFYSVRADKNSSPATTFNSEANIPFHADLPLHGDGSYPRSLHALVYESYLQSECLRNGAETESRDRQLQIILASVAPSKAEIHEWGRLFAQQHGIDYGKNAAAARLRALTIKSYALVAKTMRTANSIILDNASAPITDVHQASIAASVVRSRIGRLMSIPLAIKARSR
jgi:glycosyltransferase involved in cell wall biosynthesis